MDIVGVHEVGEVDGRIYIASGSTLAADQLTAGVVAANPTSGPTTAGDVLTYNGSALVWSAGGGGGDGTTGGAGGAGGAGYCEVYVV